MTLKTTGPMFGRVITAMITPFDGDGNVDFDEAVRLAQHLVKNGSDGLVISGTTGESATLTVAEKVELFSRISGAVGGNAVVLAGTGSYNTRETVEFSIQARDSGVDGLLVVTPYYNKPSQEGLYQHLKTVAASVDIPVMLYNVPGRTVTNLEASTVARLSAIDNIVAVKEASKNLEQIGEIVRDTPDDFLVYSGDDGTTLPILSVGGVGVVSVTSHVNGVDLQAMIAAFFASDFAEAIRLNGKSLALTKALFSFPSPSPAKTALKQLGLLNSTHVRLPLVDATEAERGAIKSALSQYGLL